MPESANGLFQPGGGTVVAMVHVSALPGTPEYEGRFELVVEKAMAEALLYAECGVDAVMIENMHDRPYLKGAAVGHEITAAMAVLGREVRRACKLPVGLQILAGANQQALAAALAGGLDFIRAEGYVFAHVADEGLMESDAGALLRYRRQIGAAKVQILTDIKKKHSSHALTGDLSLAETAEAARFFQSGGLIVTGAATGKQADLDDVRAAKEAAPDLPVLVGSGITDRNVRTYLEVADGVIVGSFLKRDGDWRQPVEGERVQQLMKAVGR